MKRPKVDRSKNWGVNCSKVKWSIDLWWNVRIIVGWRERNCRTVTFTVHTARCPAPHNHSHHKQCRTPYAIVHTLVLLMMGMMMPETCWDKRFDNKHQISCILLVSPSSPYVHDARSLEPKIFCFLFYIVCWALSSTLREKHRLSVFQNGVLRKAFVTRSCDVAEEWRTLHNEMGGAYGTYRREESCKQGLGGWT